MKLRAWIASGQLAVTLLAWLGVRPERLKRFPWAANRKKMIALFIIGSFLFVDSVVYRPHHVTATFVYRPDAPVEVIRGKTFVNETVSLDGKGYINCIFENVTFMINGTTPIHFVGNTIRGNSMRFTTENPAIFAAVGMLKGLGAFSKDVGLFSGQWDEPVTNVQPPNQK